MGDIYKLGEVLPPVEDWPQWAQDAAAEEKLFTTAFGLVAKLELIETKYNELIMAVTEKYPGESRHQTAMRFIRTKHYSDGSQAEGCGDE